MNKLSYFIKEVQRLDGVAAGNFSSYVFEDFEADGVKIKKGTYVHYNIASIHINPTQWHNPLEFIPE